MDFKTQVQGLTGLTISSSGTNPTEAEISQYLKDGVLDITYKTLAARPADAEHFLVDSDVQTAQRFDPKSGDVISVVREDGVTANSWRPCIKLSNNLEYLVTDKNSLHYASKFNPAYIILDDGRVNVYPAPGSSPDRYKVYYINNVPINNAGSALAHSDSDIGYFPAQKVYLVSIYAAIKALENKLGEYTIDEEDIELVQAMSVNLSTLKQSYNSALGMVAPQGGDSK
tara:strand:+ start:30 stop:713 length:684 start_codon:yes stop_codon:yes gene_type:complete